MISRIDIDDFLSDRKQAVNHVGWEVQTLTPNGWVAIGGTHVSRQMAAKAAVAWGVYWKGHEFRVYPKVK